jgi:pSer/pThr/pTyr-binding forkhead associated (FHA) protein
MATRTLAETSTPASTASLPPTSDTATKPVAVVQWPRYVLADSAGRYRLWTDSYAEYGRLDFLDLPAAGYISHVHFALKLERGKLYIKDLDSKNGTKVNGVDIKGRGWVPLKPGDAVEVASVIALTLTETTEP